MTKKSFIILVLSALVLSTLSFFFMKRTIGNYNIYENSVGSKVFDNFNISKIDKIIISRPKLGNIILQKISGIWCVNNLFNYPADSSKITELLKETARLQILQTVKANNKELEHLDLQDTSFNDNKPYKIEFINNKNKTLYSILIGKLRFKSIDKKSQYPLGRYIKVSSQNNVFFTDTLFNEVNYSVNNWLNNVFISIDNVKQIQLFIKNKRQWQLARKSIQNPLTLMNIKNRMINKEHITKITNTLKNLKFLSIANNKTSPIITGIKNSFKLSILTFDNIRYNIYIGNSTDNARYVKFEIIPINKAHLNDKERIFLDKQRQFENWLYLININRLKPLISSEDEFIKSSNTGKMPTGSYTYPIS